MTERGRLHRDPALVLLLATLAAQPFARPALGMVGATPILLVDVAVGGTYVAVALGWLTGRLRPRPDGLLWAGMAFVAALGLSILAAGDIELSSLVKLVAFAAYILLPWVAAQVLRDRERVEWAVRAWLAGLLVAVAVGLAGIVAFVVDRDALTSLGCVYGRLPEGPYPRVCIPFRNPNLFANYLAAGIGILLASGRVLLPRRAHVVAVAACALVAASTLSTGIGGFALSAGLTMWFTRRDRPGARPWPALALTASVLVATAFALATVGHTVPPGRGQVPLADADWHFLKGPRVHTWLSVVATVRGHPVTGLGYGSLVARNPGRDLGPWLRADVGKPLREGALPRVAEAHNAWLSVAGQSGLVGLAAFVALLVVVARRMSLRPLPVPGPLAGLPPALVAGAVGALLFHGMFAGAEEARHLWALFALAAASNALRARVTGRDAIPGTTPAS
ncbi:MAG: O-antigen ligase family protein [Actinomycetota bacterium]